MKTRKFEKVSSTKWQQVKMANVGDIVLMENNRMYIVTDVTIENHRILINLLSGESRQCTGYEYYRRIDTTIQIFEEKSNEINDD